MKKNKFLKLASGLLVLCLLTTCVISTTFAKYVTEDSASDTARVAKWGVAVDVEAGTSAWGFDKSYENTSAQVTVNADENVVAPGTDGTLARFTITGTPEVAVNLNFDVTAFQDVVLVSGDYDDATTAIDDGVYNLADDYHPVEFTLKNTTLGTTFTGTLEEVVTKVEDLSTTYANVAVNTDLSTLGVWEITWAWVIDGNDKADTTLGNAAVTPIAGATTSINFALKITATQID